MTDNLETAIIHFMNFMLPFIWFAVGVIISFFLTELFAELFKESQRKRNRNVKGRWVDICVVVIIVIAFCLILTSCGAVDKANTKQKVSVDKIDNHLVADKYTGIIYTEYECDKYGRKIYIPYYCKHGFLCRYNKKKNKVYCIFEKHDMYEENDLIIKE